MLRYQMEKPTTLNFCDFMQPSQNQLTPSTPTIINSFQDITPTNFKYNIDTPDKDEFGRAFSRHYKSIEERYQISENYSINDNNNCFTLDLLNCDDEMHGNIDIPRPQQSNSVCSSDIQSTSSSGNKCSSSSQNESGSSINHDPLKLTAKKRERNRVAAEKCRLKKQRKMKELEREKCLRSMENDKLLQRIIKQREKLKSLQTFYNKLIVGEIKPQSCYN